MAEYLIEPLDTDAEVIYQNFVEYVQTTFPEWDPSEGQLDVIIARYFSMQAAFTADMASRVQRAIYRYLGASLANIPPLPGSQATVVVHFDVDDPLDPPIDRTLAFGTLVGLTDSDGDTQIFGTLEELTVEAGTESVEVETQAVEIGVASNNITGTGELIDLVDWVSTVYAVGLSSGGSDPEQDDVYIQRLTANLALMAPRPILAQDFAIFAQNVPGVWRAAAIDNFNPGVNEWQRLTSSATGGTFFITFLGQETPVIPWNATAAQVRTAMFDLPNFDITDARFSGGPLPTTPIEIVFGGKYAYTNMATMTVDTTLLTGGALGVSVVETGSAYATDLENSVAVSAVDEAGNPLSDSIRQQVIDYLESTRAQNFLLTFVDPGYYNVDINYTARVLPRQDSDSVRTDIDSRLTQYLNPDNWGRYPPSSEARNWVLQPYIRYLELTTIIENTPGVDYTESLTFSLEGSAFTTTDKFFGGPFSLTMPGTFTGTVNTPI